MSKVYCQVRLLARSSLFLFFPLFFIKKFKKKRDTLTLPTHRLWWCVRCDRRRAAPPVLVCQCASSVDRECSKGSRGSVFSFFVLLPVALSLQQQHRDNKQKVSYVHSAICKITFLITHNQSWLSAGLLPGVNCKFWCMMHIIFISW